MLLSELIIKARAVTGVEDPEIRIVGEGGFLPILEIESRKSYDDEHVWTGTRFQKGAFACIEFID